MSLNTLLQRASRAYADRTAISVGTESYLTYGQLGRRVATLAGALRGAFGLAPGARVAIAMRNCSEYLELLFAIWHAGLCVVPINSKLHAREIAYIVESSDAKLCVLDSDIREQLLQVPDTQLPPLLSPSDEEYLSCLQGEPIAAVSTGPGDPAWLFYTSGTTGRPKGAVLTHRSLMSMTLRYFADIDHLTARDSIIHLGPLSHASGLYSLPFIAAGANNIIPRSRDFDLTEAVQLISSTPSCSFFAAPTMLRRLTAYEGSEPFETHGIRTIFYGGAPTYLEDLKRVLERFGPRLCQLYGQGEMPMTGTVLPKADHADSAHPRWEQRMMSVGIPRMGVELRVVDEQEKSLPVGQVGEVVMRSDVVMAGYWNAPEASAEALRGGWLHTGDLGFLDEEGYLTLKDRSKDVIISGGMNIYPREIEEVLLRAPGVIEVAVVGRPHTDWGEEVTAFVVTAPGAAVTADTLDALCLQYIARFKRPRSYRFVAELPKSNYGKVLKTRLRELARVSP